MTATPPAPPAAALEGEVVVPPALAAAPLHFLFGHGSPSRPDRAGASLLDRERRDRRELAPLRLQLLQDDLDRLVELVIDAGVFPGRVVLDDDVGLDTDALDDPAFPVRAVGGGLRLVERAAVEERQGAAGARHPA